MEHDREDEGDGGAEEGAGDGQEVVKLIVNHAREHDGTGGHDRATKVLAPHALGALFPSFEHVLLESRVGRVDGQREREDQVQHEENLDDPDEDLRLGQTFRYQDLDSLDVRRFVVYAVSEAGPQRKTHV